MLRKYFHCHKLVQACIVPKHLLSKVCSVKGVNAISPYHTSLQSYLAFLSLGRLNLEKLNFLNDIFRHSKKTKRKVLLLLLFSLDVVVNPAEL